MEVRLCYFNEEWNPYIYSAEKPSKYFEKESEEIKSVPGGKMRLTKHIHAEIPCLYTFGFTVNNKIHAPGHGGEWSSNSYEVNKIFGTDLKEVGLDGYSAAVSLKWLKDLIGDKATWGTKVLGQFHCIKEWAGETPERMKWITIYSTK